MCFRRISLLPQPKSGDRATIYVDHLCNCKAKVWYRTEFQKYEYTAIFRLSYVKSRLALASRSSSSLGLSCYYATTIQYERMDPHLCPVTQKGRPKIAIPLTSKPPSPPLWEIARMSISFMILSYTTHSLPGLGLGVRPESSESSYCCISVGPKTRRGKGPIIWPTGKQTGTGPSRHFERAVRETEKAGRSAARVERNLACDSAHVRFQ